MIGWLQMAMRNIKHISILLLALCLCLPVMSATIRPLKLFNGELVQYQAADEIYAEGLRGATADYLLDDSAVADNYVLSYDLASKKIIFAAGGSGSGESNVKSIAQNTHGFSVGNVLKYAAGTYSKAQSDSAANAEVVGIVDAVADVDNFTLLMGGYIDGLSSLTAGTVYFLDPSTAGALTATEPSTDDQVSKPVLIAVSTTAGCFFNMRGQVISSTQGVVGPATSTDNAIARFDGAGGTVLQDSSVIIDDSDNVTGVTELTTTYGFYHDRGDPATVDFETADFTTDNTWRDLDLSAIVPAGAKAVHFWTAIKDDAVSSDMRYRKNGNTSSVNMAQVTTQVANVTRNADITVACDTNRIIEYRGDNLTFTDIVLIVRGWWK